VYLAVILDGFSRQVVGWALDRTLASRLPITALEQAIGQRQPPQGLLHHSDRGVQYACEEYIAILKQHGMIPSMSRPANPYDNASCESFIKTLKREEIYTNQYDDLEHLRANIEEFIEQYYNRHDCTQLWATALQKNLNERLSMQIPRASLEVRA
jgi:putative transposase